MLGVEMTYLPVGVASVAWLASALAFAVSMAGTPGPNNAMLTSSGSLWGFRRTVPHMLGISVGFPIMLVAVAAGAGGIFRAHPTVLTVMRWLGAAYLLYLAWRIATAQPHPTHQAPTADDDPARPTRSGGRPLGFVGAALFQWVNPKAWLVTISAVATVATAAGHPSLARALALGGVFLAVTPPITAFWTLVGVGIARVLGSEGALRRFNVAMALLLVGSLVTVLIGIG
jgi:threonine/homoserine/homoserine lactone efflux protein